MSTNLNLPQLTEGQAAPEVTANDANAAIDAALTELLAVDLTNDVIMTDADWRSAIAVHVTTAGVNKKLTVPQIKRLVLVKNLAANAITIKRGTSEVAIPVGRRVLVHQDGTANGLDVVPFPIPPGGTTHQIMVKQSGTDYDMTWSDNYSPVIMETHTASHTLALADKGKLLECGHASGLNITVPPNADAAFEVGDYVEFVQTDSGQITFVAGSGVTILSTGGKLKTNVMYSAATLIKRATDTWYLFGDITT